MSSTEGLGLMCRYETLGRLDYINILINLLNNKKELSYRLPYAARRGHLEVVQRLLDAEADVNASAAAGEWTALQAAAKGGHLEVVQRLLDAKANVNAVAAIYEGRTALQAAAEGGHLEVVALLKSLSARN
jgi:ankyrin repeat protein